MGKYSFTCIKTGFCNRGRTSQHIFCIFTHVFILLFHIYIEAKHFRSCKTKQAKRRKGISSSYHRFYNFLHASKWKPALLARICSCVCVCYNEYTINKYSVLTRNVSRIPVIRHSLFMVPLFCAWKQCYVGALKQRSPLVRGANSSSSKCRSVP